MGRMKDIAIAMEESDSRFAWEEATTWEGYPVTYLFDKEYAHNIHGESMKCLAIRATLYAHRGKWHACINVPTPERFLFLESQSKLSLEKAVLAAAVMI